MNAAFREQLDDKLGLKVSEDAYVAMDYHLDWIAAAQHMATKGSSVSAASSSSAYFKNHPNDRKNPLICGNQQDTDLLVAYKSEDRVVLIMIEAKADSKWCEKQIWSKAERLADIFQKRDSNRLVDPYFVFMGPTDGKSSAQSRFEELSVSSRWIFSRGGKNIAYLCMDPPKELYRPERVDGTQGRYLGFKIRKTKKFVFNESEAGE